MHRLYTYPCLPRVALRTLGVVPLSCGTKCPEKRGAHPTPSHRGHMGGVANRALPCNTPNGIGGTVNATTGSRHATALSYLPSECHIGTSGGSSLHCKHTLPRGLPRIVWQVEASQRIPGGRSVEGSRGSMDLSPPPRQVHGVGTDQ